MRWFGTSSRNARARGVKAPPVRKIIRAAYSENRREISAWTSMPAISGIIQVAQHEVVPLPSLDPFDSLTPPRDRNDFMILSEDAPQRGTDHLLVVHDEDAPRRPGAGVSDVALAGAAP